VAMSRQHKAPQRQNDGQDMLRTFRAAAPPVSRAQSPPVHPSRVCRCFNKATYQGGTPEVDDCGGDCQTWNSKVCARTWARDLYMFGPPRWRTLRPVWGIKYGALRLVLGCSRCPTRYPALLYIVQGRVPSRLQGRSPSSITQNGS
jgi:hypothetical protein